MSLGRALPCFLQAEIGRTPDWAKFKEPRRRIRFDHVRRQRSRRVESRGIWLSKTAFPAFATGSTRLSLSHDLSQGQRPRMANERHVLR